MGKLAQQLSKQSQVKVFAKGGKVQADLTKAMSKAFPQGATITPAKKNGGKCK